MSDPQRIYFLGFEIQHIFVTQLSVSERNSEGAKLLRSIGFDLDARSNQLAVFKNAATLAALRNAPADIQVAFAAAGFGWNQQNSTGNADSQVNAHPEYNRFNVETLNDLALDAVEFDWTPETKRRAVYDLHRFMTNFNASGSLSIQGTTQQQFDQAWAAWQAQNGTENYKTLSTEAAAAIDSYATAFDATPVGAGEDNSVMRAEIAANLLTQLEGVLTPKELANAQRYFDNGSFTGGVASLIHDAQLRSSTPVLGNGIAAENLAIKLWSSEDAFLDLDVLIDKLKGVFDFMTGFADSMADNISALGDDLIATIGKSVNAMLVGLGGSAIGDIVEFLNAAYEPIKKGFRTGDWSDFGETVAQYGVAAAISAVLVIGSVAIATAVAGPIAAAFVAAGWAAYGLYDAITNGVELLGKISADLADVIPKIGETIEDIGKAIEKYVAVISRIVANAMDVDFNAPIFAGADGPLSLVNKYIVDSLDPDLPGRIKGSDQNERFYGRNNAFIDAGGGNDEAHVRHTTTALGGAGDDILAGADARVIRAGAPLNLDAPNGAVAANDLRMLLDGGAGDDWVFALGGTGAIIVGGEGRDFLYNSSRGGQLWGDGLDGRGASGSGAASSDTFWWSAGKPWGKSDLIGLRPRPQIAACSCRSRAETVTSPHCQIRLSPRLSS